MMDQVTSRLAHRGDVSGAAATAIRALRLSPESADRARRLAIAAYYSVKAGKLGRACGYLTVLARPIPNSPGR